MVCVCVSKHETDKREISLQSKSKSKSIPIEIYSESIRSNESIVLFSSSASALLFPFWLASLALGVIDKHHIASRCVALQLQILLNELFTSYSIKSRFSSICNTQKIS